MSSWALADHGMSSQSRQAQSVPWLSQKPEAAPHHVLVAADHDDGPAAHVLLLAYHLLHAIAPEVGQRLGGMLEVALPRGRLRWRHRGREIHEPFRVGGEPAHDLEGRGRM